LVEFVSIDESVTVDISAGDEFLELLVVNSLSNLVRNSSEVLDGDETGSLVIIESEDFVDVGSAVSVSDSLGHEGEPFSEIDGSVTVSVEVGNHLEDGLVFSLEAEGDHGSLELWMLYMVPLISTDPPWSVSNRSNACLAKVTSSSVTPFLAQALASKDPLAAGAEVLAGAGPLADPLGEAGAALAGAGAALPAAGAALGGEAGLAGAFLDMMDIFIQWIQ